MEEIRRPLPEDYVAYCRYYRGCWWSPTGYEVYHDGTWYTELVNDDGEILLLN